MSLIEKSLPLSAMQKAASKVVPILQEKGIEPGSERAFEYASYLLDVERGRVAQMQKTIKRRTAAAILLLVGLVVALIFLLAGGAPREAADAAPQAAYIQERNYVASANSDKYHLPSCDYAGNILEGNRVYYATAQAAVDAGKVPCSVCRPDQTLSTSSQWGKLRDAECISLTYREWLDFLESREGGTASSFLRETAEDQAERVDQEYGPGAYGGSDWMLWTALKDAGYTSVSMEEFSSALE